MSAQKAYPYCTYDVFTTDIFGGNPLAVVWEADELSAQTMQSIAREFNYSETVFLLPPKDPLHTARLRIFTPTQELPFAGHPTIGAIIALVERDTHQTSIPTSHARTHNLTLELGIGLLQANFSKGRASFHATQELSHLAKLDADFIAQVLGLKPIDIVGVPEMATLGVPFTFTQVASRSALAEIQIDLTAMKQGNQAHPSSRDFSHAAYWIASQDDGKKIIHMRMFAPLDSIPEDPATGSAAAALAALFVEKTKSAVFLTIYQGEDMGRPSQINVSADESGVTLSGAARKIMDGQIYL